MYSFLALKKFIFNRLVWVYVIYPNLVNILFLFTCIYLFLFHCCGRPFLRCFSPVLSAKVLLIILISIDCLFFSEVESLQRWWFGALLLAASPPSVLCVVLHLRVLGCRTVCLWV